MGYVITFIKERNRYEIIDMNELKPGQEHTKGKYEDKLNASTEYTFGVLENKDGYDESYIADYLETIE